MFKQCSNLAELNAARIQATTAPDADLVAINNAYNARRQEILSSRSKVRKLIFIEVKPDPVERRMGIPVVGNSDEVGTIQLRGNGFYY